MSLEQFKTNLTKLKAKVIANKTYIKVSGLSKLVIATAITFIKCIKLSYDVTVLEQRKAELEEMFSDIEIEEIPIDDIENLSIDEIAYRIASEMKKTVSEIKVEK
jgi:hypothetical protein